MAAPTPIFKGYTSGVLISGPESGQLHLGERGIWTFVYRGTLGDAQSYAISHPRGTMGTILGVACYVDDVSVASEKGGVGAVTVKWCRTDVLPPDEFSITPLEVNPPIVKNPFFAALTQNDLKLARTNFQASSVLGATVADPAINAAANSGLIKNLVAKWMKGVETYYLAGIQYQWTRHYNSLSGVTIRRGGYSAGPSDDYGSAAPGLSLLPNGGWMRKCDEVVWNNGVYKVTRTWIWGPSGYWDTDLYGTSPI